MKRHADMETDDNEGKKGKEKDIYLATRYIITKTFSSQQKDKK